MLIPARNEISQREGKKFPELPAMFAGQAKSVLGGGFDGLSLSSAAVELLSQLPKAPDQFKAPFTAKPTCHLEYCGHDQEAIDVATCRSSAFRTP
jgi:hypothetical protein